MRSPLVEEESFRERWNGVVWVNLGAGVNNVISDLVRLPDGRIIAGGWFTSAGGVPANCVAQWDGAAWSPVGSANAFTVADMVVALTTLDNGDLIATGKFIAGGRRLRPHRPLGWVELASTGDGAVPRGCAGPAHHDLPAGARQPPAHGGRQV